MKCQKCGNKNPHGARYCGYCQNELKRTNTLVLPVVVSAILLACAVAIGVLIGLLVAEGNQKIPETQMTIPNNPTGMPISVEVHEHIWKPADCDNPQVCISCGEISGTELGHQWVDATYESPKTCTICGKTSGSVLNPLAKLSVGDSFKLGAYEQDGYSGNGTEDIEWIVLEKNNDRIFVISKYALDCQRYHKQEEYVSWANCSVRTWLNSVFYNAAFDSEEKQLIESITVESGAGSDNVFLLSLDELNEYFSNKKERVCRATSYAIDQNAYVNSSTGGSWWLLRTQGKSSRHVMSVNSDGTIDTEGGRVQADRGTIRPVMWLKID